MKAPFSAFLDAAVPALRELIAQLKKRYDYVSLLGTDSVGFSLRISQRSKSLGSDTMMTERGFVVRVARQGLYSEAAFNDQDLSDAQALAERLTAELSAQLDLLKELETQPYVTGLLPDEPRELRVEMETGRLPETEDLSGLVQRLCALSDEGVARGKDVLDCIASAQSTHVCKLFLTQNQELRQSYVYSEGWVACLGARNGRNEMGRGDVSDRCGPELFDDLAPALAEALRITEELLEADRIDPGTYDIITAPDVTGLIAHEAFGHGVEMDMFVKERALGAAYLGKRVGSDRVTMHEGAACIRQVASYAFDDEGTPAGDVTEIEHGILQTGICDALSALRLGVSPTGNGKRQNFEHKVYTRMTNTLFDSGTDRLEDMIASISFGYLLAGVDSGMEDPKHWGIQCIVQRGYEIRDGRLTGRVVAPVVMTGYVPDLLGSVSMVSPHREAFGNGGCGKGHKEWVKVSDGGPYLKAKARLG